MAITSTAIVTKAGKTEATVTIYHAREEAIIRDEEGMHRAPSCYYPTLEDLQAAFPKHFGFSIEVRSYH